MRRVLRVPRPAVVRLAVVLTVGVLSAGDIQGQSAAVEGHSASAAVGWNAESQWDFHFQAGESMVEIPFRYEYGRIVIDVSVNGSRPLPFLVDAGWPNSALLGPEKIVGTDLGIPERDGEASDGSGRVSRMHVAQGIRLDIGGLRVEGAEMEVMPPDGLGPVGSLRQDGILGGQFLSGLVVEIDWDASLMRLHDPSRFEGPPDVTVVPLENRRGMIFVSASVTLDGESQSVRLFVDTGDPQALSLRSDRVKVPAQRITDVFLGRSLFGEIRGDLGRTDGLRLGDVVLDGVVTSFLDASSGMVTAGADGTLGTGVLRRFVVTFDYARDRMLLKPTEGATKPFPFTTSGLRFARRIADDGSLLISVVYPGSPAAREDILRGDRVLSVNGRPVVELGFDTVLARLTDSPGTLVTLEIRGDGSVRSVELMLERIL